LFSTILDRLAGWFYRIVGGLMPLYEYQCKDCGVVSEVIQKFSDAPLSECANCDGRVERLVSAPAIQFKGSGWYITDYAKSGKGSKSEAKDKSNGTDKKVETKASSSKPKSES